MSTSNGVCTAKPVLEALAHYEPSAGDMETLLDIYDAVGRGLAEDEEPTPLMRALGEALQVRSPYENSERMKSGRGREVAIGSSYAFKLHALAKVFTKTPPSDAERSASRDSADSLWLACLVVYNDPARHA
jgi:hypothetical protein